MLTNATKYANIGYDGIGVDMWIFAYRHFCFVGESSMSKRRTLRSRPLRKVNNAYQRKDSYIAPYKKKLIEKLAYMVYHGASWDELVKEFGKTPHTLRSWASTDYYNECFTKLVAEDAERKLKNIRSFTALKRGSGK